jgi:hypothetical protein
VTRSLLRIAVPVAVVVLLLVTVGETLHMRSERNRAQAMASRLRASVGQLESRLETSDQVIESLHKEIDSGNQIVDGLRGQIEWDKSHLLDCWTAIARGVPIESIPVSLRSLIGAARSGATLSHFITRCASDAVP